MDKKQITGYLFHEKFMWHDGGNYNPGDPYTQPIKHFESAESKRRFHNLLTTQDELYDSLYKIKPREATEEEIALNHTQEYIEKVKTASENYGGDMGDFAHITKGGYQLCTLAVGGCLNVADQILEKKQIQNGYCLVRPPGHHAVKDQGMGFCIFNNLAITAKYILKKYPELIKKIAIIDYDVHHGNGTQEAFYDSDQVLFISIHQDKNYPNDTGFINEIGSGKGIHYNINVPLPPGSGEGAYKYAFEKIVNPSINEFKPDIILVSSGFDASGFDPLGAMILSSQNFGYMAKQIVDLSEKHCEGRSIFFHEGGYSEIHVPFCGLQVLEKLTNISTDIVDSYGHDIKAWGYQEIQEHQKKVIDQVATENVQNLIKSLQKK